MLLSLGKNGLSSLFKEVTVFKGFGSPGIWSDRFAPSMVSMTRRRGRPRPQGIFKNFGQKNFGLEISPAIYRAKNPENPKSLKKSPERSLGPPEPGPPKSPKKVRKVKKIVDFQTFSWLFGLFSDFLGVRARGVPNSSRETFWDFSGFRGFWLCRWRGRSQLWAEFSFPK